MKQRQTSDVTDAKEQDADTRENDAERSGTDRDTHVAEDCSPDQRREQGTQGTGGQDRDIANNDDSGADGVDAERNADGEPGGLRGLLRRIRLRGPEGADSRGRDAAARGRWRGRLPLVGW